MALSDLTVIEIVETGFSTADYKGFSVLANSSRYGFEFSIMVMLESDSDAAHVIASGVTVHTMRELKNEVKELVSQYPYTAKQILKMNESESLNNHDSRERFEFNSTGHIVKGAF